MFTVEIDRKRFGFADADEQEAFAFAKAAEMGRIVTRHEDGFVLVVRDQRTLKGRQRG